MVRLRSGSKHRKVQTKVKNKKKKRNSVSRGTETDFDQVDETKAVHLDDSFGIWMGGKTSTPEKNDSSPTSVWYSHRRFDINDHSAHSIVFFEETLNASKSGTKLDSSDPLDPKSNICKKSTDYTEGGSLQDKSPMQHLWQPDRQSHMGSVQDESGTLVLESSGKVFFRHGVETKNSEVDGGSSGESHDIGGVDLSQSHLPEQSQSIVLMEESSSHENQVNCCQLDVDRQEDVALKISSETSQNKTSLKCKSTEALKTESSSVSKFVRSVGLYDQQDLLKTTSRQNEDELVNSNEHFRQEEKDSVLLTVDKTNKTKSIVKFPSYRPNQTENLKGPFFPKSYLTDDIHYVKLSTNFSDETYGEDLLSEPKEEENKENGSPLGQIPNKSRSRRCIALRNDDVMTNFDDAMNDLKDKLKTFYDHSEVEGPARAKKRQDRSSSVKFDSIFEYPSKRNPLSSKMTSLNLNGYHDGRPTALSDITNSVNFVRAQYRAPTDVKFRDPSTVTSRTLPTQRKWADIPDKHIYSNLPSMMFPCLTNKSETYDASNQSNELTYLDFSRTRSYQEKENCDTLKNQSAFVPHISDPSQGFEDQKQDQLLDPPTDNSSSEDGGRENGSNRDAVHSSFPFSQTSNALLARNHAQPLSRASSEDSELTRVLDFRQHEKQHRCNSVRLPKSSLSPPLKIHDDERPRFQLFTTSNISMSSQENLLRRSESNHKNSHSSQPGDRKEVCYDYPESNHYDIPYETDYFERKVEKLNAKNRQSELNLEISESSINRPLNKTTQSQDVHDKYVRQTESLSNDEKPVRGKENVISKIPKLLEFYENHGTKTYTGKSKLRRSCIPVTSTMSVSSRVNMFEENTERYSSGEEGIAVGSGPSRHGSSNSKTNSSKHKKRRSLPASSTCLPSCDKLTNVDKSYETGHGSSHFETVSHGKKETQTVIKQTITRRHHEKPPNREAIVLFEFSYHLTRKREAIIFQRGEVVQVLGNWIDGQVRVRKCSDKTEAILPKKCLFFISGDASITMQAGYFRYGSNYSDKTSHDSQQRESKIKANHLNENNLLEPFLVVRPYLAESTNEVTVLRGEVIIMNSKLVQEDVSGWSWVYVPRTQGFGFVPSSVARPLTFEPVPE